MSHITEDMLMSPFQSITESYRFDSEEFLFVVYILYATDSQIIL